MSIGQFINEIDSCGGLVSILYTQLRNQDEDIVPTPDDNILEMHPRFAAIWRNFMESYATLGGAIDEYYSYVESCQHDTERK